MVQASRSHYCVHNTVSKKPNVDDECDKLLEDRSCKFFNNMAKLLGLQNSSVVEVIACMMQLVPEMTGFSAWEFYVVMQEVDKDKVTL